MRVPTGMLTNVAKKAAYYGSETLKDVRKAASDFSISGFVDTYHSQELRERELEHFMMKPTQRRIKLLLLMEKGNTLLMKSILRYLEKRDNSILRIT